MENLLHLIVGIGTFWVGTLGAGESLAPLSMFLHVHLLVPS